MQFGWDQVVSCGDGWNLRDLELGAEMQRMWESDFWERENEVRQRESWRVRGLRIRIEA